MLEDIRPHYPADPDLVRVLLNSTSWVEASLAVELLAETVPERALVTATNIREAIKELPRCPMRMATDFERLSRVVGLERDGMGWSRIYEDTEGDYIVELLGDGNYCYDIVIHTDDDTLMWMPRSHQEDYLNPDVIDLIMLRPTVLRNVVELLDAMGQTFSPIFYLSIEDWRQEYAETIFAEVVQVFGPEGESTKAAASRMREAELTGTHVRVRGHSDEGGLSWIF